MTLAKAVSYLAVSMDRVSPQFFLSKKGKKMRGKFTGLPHQSPKVSGSLFLNLFSVSKKRLGFLPASELGPGV